MATSTSSRSKWADPPPLIVRHGRDVRGERIRNGYQRRSPPTGASSINLLAIDIDAEGNVYVIDDISQIIDARTVATVRMVDSTGHRIDALHQRCPSDYAEESLADAVSDYRGARANGAIYIANTEPKPGPRTDAVRASCAPWQAPARKATAMDFATQAMFSLPAAIAVADDGTLVVADEGNNLIRTIAPSEGPASPRPPSRWPAPSEIPRLGRESHGLRRAARAQVRTGVPRFMDGASRRRALLSALGDGAGCRGERDRRGLRERRNPPHRAGWNGDHRRRRQRAGSARRAGCGCPVLAADRVSPCIQTARSTLPTRGTTAFAGSRRTGP